MRPHTHPMGDPFKIAVSGLTAAASRVEVSARNIAGATTTGRLPETPEGATNAYRPQEVRTTPVPVGGVLATSVDRVPAFVPAYDPSSPDADAQGRIATPNVDLAREAVEGIAATQTYKANAAVIKIARDIDKKLIDILG